MTNLTFTVSKTFREVSNGALSDHGFEYEEQEFTLRELIDELDECLTLSDTPVDSETWAETEPYGTGTEWIEAYHIEKINGHQPKASQLQRVYKLAGLVK